MTSAIILDLLNEAVKAIAAESLWPWLQTSETLSTSTSSQELTPNANWTFTKALWITGFPALAYVPLERFIEYADTGQPVVYTIDQGKIKVAPQPNIVYSINHVYYKTETTLVSGSDAPVLPTQFYNAIVAKAAAIGFQRANQLDAYQIEAALSGEWMTRIKRFARRQNGPIPIKTTRSYQ
jgi:hypothetical protein